MNIREFIEERLAEDLDEARHIHNRDSDAYLNGDCVCGYPERALRQVAAGRRVLARHEPTGFSSDPDCYGCPVDESGWRINKISECPELRDLAAVYSDHPDYQESWRP